MTTARALLVVSIVLLVINLTVTLVSRASADQSKNGGPPRCVGITVLPRENGNGFYLFRAFENGNVEQMHHDGSWDHNIGPGVR